MEQSMFFSWCCVNRQYDTLTSAQNGEEYDPLERRIRQGQSRIAQSNQTAAEGQAAWLKKQTELVSLKHSCDDLNKLNGTQQAHFILNHHFPTGQS
jgi:hypothetical protein